MNLFYLDDDIDLCAEYHIDDHVGKMQLEATQLLSTALWCDRLFGFTPRALTSEEYTELKRYKALESKNLDERTFTRYLPGHHNHPSAIWVRSSLEHFYWTIAYVNALDSESLYRGRKAHASCIECNRLPEPIHLKDVGFVRPFQAMPDELKTNDVLADYRLFYHLDKAAIPATWKHRGKPWWWNEDLAMYDRRYTSLSPAERRATGYLK